MHFLHFQFQQNTDKISKNEILNSTYTKGYSIYLCTVDIYSFIYSWYGYITF